MGTQHRWLLGLALVGGAVGTGGRADAAPDAACALDCPQVTATLIAPKPGETGVPTNAVISVRWQGTLQPPEDVSGVALQDAGGNTVAVQLEAVPWANPYTTTERLAPAAPLAAGATYSVVRVATGETLGSFTVSDAADTTAPTTVDVLVGDPSTVCGDLCCPDQMGAPVGDLEYSFPGVVGEPVEWVVRDGNFPENILAADLDGAAVGVINCVGASLRCGLDSSGRLWFDVSPNGPIEISVATRDRAGNESPRVYVSVVGYCSSGGDGPIPDPLDGGNGLSSTGGGGCDAGGGAATPAFVLVALLVIRRRRLAIGALLVGVFAATPAHAGLTIGDEHAIDDPVPSPDQEAGYLNLATDGTQFLAAWSTNYPFDRVHAGRVALDGSVVDTIPIALPSSTNRQLSPTVVWDGTTYVVIWGEVPTSSDPNTPPTTELYAARVGADGSLLDAQPILLAAAQLNYFQAAAVGGVTLVSWASADGRIQLVRFANGALVDTTPIDIASDGGWSGAMSCTAATCLVVWHACPTNSSCEVRAHRIDPTTGSLLETDPLAIGPGYWSRVASDGTQWLVAYRLQDVQSDGGHLAVALVDAAGSVTRPSLTISGPWTAWLNLAFDGTNFLLVWQESRPMGAQPSGFEMRISPAGAALDPAGGVQLPGVPQLGSIACASGECAVPLGRTVLLLENGTPVLPAPIDVAFASNREVSPAVAAANGGYLVAWQDSRNAADGDDVMGRFTSADGTPTATTFPIASATGDQTSPAVGWDGVSNVVAWRDNDVIRAARVAADGTVLPAGGVDISGDVLTTYGVPSVGCAPAIGCLIAWPTNPAAYDVDARGMVLPPGADINAGTSIEISDRDTYPDRITVAASSSVFLVVWSGNGADNGFFVRGSIVSPDGSVAHPGGVQIAAQDPNDPTHLLYGDPSATSDGTEFLVAWGESAPSYPGCDPELDPSGCEQTDVYATRVLDDGTILDSGSSRIPAETSTNNAGTPSAVWTGRSYFVAWSAGALVACPAGPTCWEYRGVRVSRGGNIVDSSPIETGVVADVSQAAPAFTSGADGSLVTTYNRTDLSPGYGSPRVELRTITGDDTADDWVSPSNAGCCDAGTGPEDEAGAILLVALVGVRRTRGKPRR